MSKKSKAEGFGPGNTDSDGNYIVGKNRPPAGNRFKPGDGRKRGRRDKGTRNLATDLREELEHMVEVSVAGIRRTVSRQRAIMMRLADNASRGDTRAIALVVGYQQRIVEPELAAEAESERRKDEFDPSRLTTDELRTMERILGKASGLPGYVEPKPLLDTCDEDGVPMLRDQIIK